MAEPRPADRGPEEEREDGEVEGGGGTGVRGAKNEGEGAVDAEGIEGGGEQGGEQVGAKAAAGEEQQSFEEHARGAHVNHPARQGSLEEGDPAGGLGAAEGRAEVLEQDDGEAEDGGLSEAIAEFATAVGNGPVEDRTERVGGWGMGRWRVGSECWIDGGTGVWSW